MPNIKEFDRWYEKFQTDMLGRAYTHEQLAMEAFSAGYECSQREPVNTVELKAGQILSRTERDTLVSALAYLVTLQRETEGTAFFFGIQATISAISRMLNE